MRHYRVLLSTAAMLSFGAVAFADSHTVAPAEPQRFEMPNTYLFGAAFETADASTVSACRLQCDTDVRCDAWSFRPETLEGPARCEIKFSVGKSMTYPGAISGVAAKYDSTPVAVSEDQELSGGEGSPPSQPSAKTDPSVASNLRGGDVLPRVYRGNELAGPANILTPPKEGESSPLLPALRSN